MMPGQIGGLSLKAIIARGFGTHLGTMRMRSSFIDVK